MRRTPAARASLVAAAIFGVAPCAVGLLRAWTSTGDFRVFWMALVASLYAGGVLASAVGRRRPRRQVVRQAVVIFIVATVLAVGTAYVLDASAGPGVWAMSAALGLSLAAASVFVAYARPRAG